MYLGVQFRDSVPAGATRRWFTHSWNANWRVLWMMAPTWPMIDGPAQLEWKVRVSRQATDLVKYHIEVSNVSTNTVEFEARYAILNL